MREIKFRVYDKINKEWLIYKDCNVGWLVGMTGQKTLADDPPKPNMMKMYCSPDGSTFNDLQFCIDSDDFEVVQYTGRKDINGTEIFEGDIVNVIQKSNTHRAVIKYSTYRTGFWFDPEWCHQSMHSTLEVVGNIYQDSHLLDNPK